MIFLAVMTKNKKEVKKITLHSAAHSVQNYIILHTERSPNTLQVFNVVFFLLSNITPGTAVPRGILGVRGPLVYRISECEQDFALCLV